MWVTAVLPLLAAIGSSNAFVDPNVRLDCFPDPNASADACRARKCIWDEHSFDQSLHVPMCYFDQKPSYSFESQKTGLSVELTKAAHGIVNPFYKDFEKLQFSYSNIGSTINVRISPNQKRFEPPLDLPRDPSKSLDNLKVELPSSTEKFSFAIRRESTGTKIWDTSIGGLLFGDQFIQIATYLPSDKIYGFGQNIHQHLKHNLTRYTTWGMFSRDWGPDSKDFNTLNLYGVQPFYLAIEPDGKTHGVLILNSNAQEVTTGPGPHLIYRTIGGLLDIYFFPGPTPEQVVKQYLDLVGKPFLPAYWALGYQISHWGYKTLAHMKAAYQRTIDSEIPVDVQVADIDYMDKKRDFTLNPEDDWAGFPKYLEDLHSSGHRSIFILDPGIEADYGSFKRAIETDARFIEWPRADLIPSTQQKYPLTNGTKIMLGKVWPDNFVGFPDFLDPTNKTDDWWTNEFKLLHKQAAFDGIWIDMNEPSNFDTNSDTDKTMLQCPRSGADANLDVPKYETRNVYQWPAGTHLATKTLCMFARTARDTENFYDTKCLYGWSESRSTAKALSATTGQRGAVIARSTFPSSGRYTGTWLGDNTARWEDLRTTVIGVMEFNIFGIPYVGSDICGFNGNTTEELCLRWQQLGAFHSFMRNHNSINMIPQDPGVWPDVARAAKKANDFRYRHLPYMFSLHFAASRDGGTVVRPAFFEFPHDEQTHELSHQFMLGPAMMIIPVIYEHATTVRGYLPETTDGWYSLYDDNYGVRTSSGYHNFRAPKTFLIPVFVRGGQIVPRQVSAQTTVASRKNPFELLITSAPAASKGSTEASGHLLWDDGVTLVDNFKKHPYYDLTFNYEATEQTGRIDIFSKSYRATSVDQPAFEHIEIFGYKGTPNFDSFAVNGAKIKIDLQKSSYNPSTQVLNIYSKELVPANRLANAITWKIVWRNQ